MAEVRDTCQNIHANDPSFTAVQHRAHELAACDIRDLVTFYPFAKFRVTVIL